ncbi:MAG: hypothetical protein ACJ8A4_17900 [Microvirga sp.]|jgi:hypothetical protein
MSTNVTVINIFALQPAYTEQGLGQVSGTPSDATKKLQTQLGKMVGTVFAAKWPTADTNDPMTGIMGPWDNSQGGTAPKCATDQITLDFGSWGIDAEPGIIDHMAKTITMHLANTMGSTGTMAGSSAVTGSEKIYWAVGFAVVDVGQGTPPEKGVIYAYTAAEGLD